MHFERDRRLSVPHRLPQDKADGQSLGSADERRSGAARFAGKFNGLQPGEQLLEENPHFKPPPMPPQTDMGTVTEGNMARRITVDAEAFGGFEGLLVAVAGRVAQHQPVALSDM